MLFSILSNSRSMYSVQSAMVYLMISSDHTPFNKHVYNGKIHNKGKRLPKSLEKI